MSKPVLLSVFLAASLMALPVARMALPPDFDARSERIEIDGFGGFNKGINRLIALLALASGVASGAFLDKLNILNVENGTGSSIRYLFVSPGDSRHWGADLLGATGPLMTGDYMSWFIHYPDRCGRFNVLAVTTADRQYLIRNFAICDGKSAVVQLDYRDVSQPDVERDFVTVGFENGTEFPLSSLFFTPGDSDLWGVDHLEASTSLEPGGVLTLKLPAMPEDVVFAVRAVDTRHRTYSFSVNVDAGEQSIVFEILPDWVDK